MEILYSKRFTPFGKQEQASMYVLSTEEKSFFKKQGCEIIQSQWIDYNEIVKRLPDPYLYLSIHLTDNYDYIGELLCVMEEIPTIRGPFTTVTTAKEFRSDDLIELYNMCITEAKKGIRKYNKEVLDRL